MKTIHFIATMTMILFSIQFSTAQQSEELPRGYVDVKINPMYLSISSLDYSADFLFSENFSLEVNSEYLWNFMPHKKGKRKGYTVSLRAKAYLGDKYAAGYYMGAYAKYARRSYDVPERFDAASSLLLFPFLITDPAHQVESKKMSFGYLTGYKIVLPKKFMVDIGGGLGMNLDNDVQRIELDGTRGVKETSLLDAMIYVGIGYRF